MTNNTKQISNENITKIIDSVSAYSNNFLKQFKESMTNSNNITDLPPIDYKTTIHSKLKLKDNKSKKRFLLDPDLIITASQVVRECCKLFVKK